MADLPAARKRLGDRLAHYTIDLCARVVADRLHFRRVGLAVRERRFFNGAIENASDDIAVILVHNYSMCRSSEPASGTANSSFRNSSSAHLPFSKHYTTYTRPFGTIPANKSTKLSTECLFYLTNWDWDGQTGMLNRLLPSIPLKYHAVKIAHRSTEKNTSTSHCQRTAEHSHASPKD